MPEINTKLFDKRYETRPIIFHEANSPHFMCKFAFREDDTVLHIHPAFKPVRPEFKEVLTEAVDSCMGIKKDDAKIEYIEDELIEDPSFYVCLSGFGETHSMNKILVEKILTKLHENL